MSLTDEYYAARKKRKKKEEEEVVKKTSSGSTLDKEYYTAQQNRVSQEEDIAPVRAEVESVARRVAAQDNSAYYSAKKDKANTKEERTWFKAGAFDDGYQFGDVTKTILGTVGDVALPYVKGIVYMGEGVGDLLSYGDAYIHEKLGHEHQAETIRKRTKESVTDILLGGVEKAADRNSLLGSRTNAVVDPLATGLGTVATVIATGGIAGAAGVGATGVSALTTGTMFASSFGSGISEAYQGGATDEEAVKHGFNQGAIDAGTELLFGGLGRSVKALGLSRGLSSLDDIFARKLSSKISNQVAKNYAELGVKGAFEGIEEVLAGIGSAVNKKFTYMSDEELTQLIKDERLLDQFVVGTVTSGIAQSGIVPGMKNGSVRDANEKGRDYITGLSSNEQKVVDKEFENRIAKEEEDGKKLSGKEKSAIYDAVVSDMEKGYISTDTIEEVLGGETYKTYKDTIDSEDALSNEYEELGKKSNATLAEQSRYAELKQKLDDIKQNSQRNQLKSKLGEEVFGLVQNDRLAESYNERSRRGQAFEADLTQYDEKQKAVVQKAVESGILNNTRRTHEFVDMIAKISADKGVLFDFTNNERLKGTTFAVDGKTVNGFVTKDGVTLNIDSAKSLNSVVGHEITHVLEGTELYTELQNVLKSYAETKGEYQTRYDSLSETYKNIEGANIDAELTADLVGDYLFTDPDFINNLSANNRNVFQKIYDEIKYLCKVATAGSKEARELEKVKRAFEKAYRDGGKTQETEDADTKYSIVTDKDTIDFLENQDYIVTYKAMQVVDGKLYPPMSAQTKETVEYTDKKGNKKTKTVSKWKQPSELGKWQQSDENPGAIKKFNSKGVGVFDLIKGNGKTIQAAYNPYEHTSNIVLNDQFEEAYNRDNLVTVEYHIPVSELTSGYKAQYAKDAVGLHEWKSGPVAKDLKDPRKVYLTRWSKPVRILPDSEVAAKYKEILDGTGLSVPFNVVTPSLLAELEKAGVAIDYEGSPMYKSIQKRAAEKKAKYSVSDSDGKQLTKEQQEYFKDSKVRDDNGNLKVMYQGGSGDFTVFDRKKSSYSNLYGRGFYFTNSESHAKQYGNARAFYLDIKNPVSTTEQTISEDQMRNFLEAVAENEDDYSFENYGYGATVDSVLDSVYSGKSDFAMLYDVSQTAIGDMVAAVELFNEVNGTDYDGLILDTETVAFRSNQIKNTDNLKPTADKDIRYSLTEYTEDEKKAHNKAVVDHFGKTYNWAETGYVLLDGTKLDLSGKHEGAPGGYRTVDHRDIVDALGSDYGDGSYSGSLVQFMSEGNIRISPESDGINLSVKPTKAQEQALSAFISRARGEVLLDIDGLDGYTEVSVEYPRGTHSSKVLNDIREWFDNGKKPEVSNLSPFRSLSNKGEQIAPVGNYNVYGKDIALSKQETETSKEISKETQAESKVPFAESEEVAPVSEEVIAENATTMFPDDPALTGEPIPGQFDSLTDADAPPEMEAPYYEESEELEAEDPFENRDWYEVSNRKVKAYMYDHPEVKPFFQAEAAVMLDELNSTTKGEKWFNDHLYYESGGEEGFGGTKRHTSDSIATMLDEWNMSYADIEKGLQAIIEDHGAENIAAAKKVEFMLNERLLSGYKSFTGYEPTMDRFGNVPQNQDYINMLAESQIVNAYSKESFDALMAEADSYVPPVEEDIAPVPMMAERNPVLTEAYEAIRPKREKQPKLIRVDSAESEPSGKQRKWVKTSTESEAVDGKILPDDLDQEKINYQPIPNKVTLGKANSRLDSMGYEAAVTYFNSQFANKSVSLEDVALGERLIQEAIKRGDNKTAGELIQNVSILGTELGQKVQALSIIKRLTPEGQLGMLQKTVERGKTKGDKSFEGVEVTQDMIDKILSAYNPDGTYDQTVLNEMVEDVKQQIADKMKVTALDKVNAWRYLSMLGNPKTHIRNLVSNVAMRGTMGVKNALARTVESVAPISSRTKTWKSASEDVKNYASRTATEMKDIISGENRYDESAGIKQKRTIFKNKILNGVYEFNSDMLGKEDWWFSKAAFTSSLSEFLTANGINTAEDIKRNPEIVDKARQYALEQSQIATFRQYSWLANKINEIERRNTATNIAVGAIVPFKKTPINIAKTGLSYSPLGFAKTLTYDMSQVKKGDMEASEMIDHLAQNVTGSALALVGYMLAQSGLINGAGDDDKEGDYDYQLGKQAYSVNIGGATYSLSWLSPVAMPLFVGANAYEQLVEGKEWNGDVVVETLAQTLDPLSEMSFISSLDSVLSSYDSGIQKFAGIGETMAQNYITQFAPTLMSQVATVMDDTKRSTKVSGDSDFKFVEQTINKLKYKIPFLRETLEPTTDIWGNEVKQTENVMTRAFETFLAPYAKRDSIATEIDDEIKELYAETGDTGLIPSIPYNYVNYDGEKYKMSAADFTEFKKNYGQTAVDLMDDLFATDTYQNADSEARADMVNRVYDYARDEARREYFAKYGVEFTNSTKDGEEVYKPNSIKGAIENDMTPDEYSFYAEYPEKYEFFNENGISYETYKNADEDGKRAYTWAYENPGKFTMSKAISDDFMEYYGYKSELNDIKGVDNNGDGRSDSGTAKAKKTDYINSLDLDYGQKIILYRSLFSSKADKSNYNMDIIEYLNSRDDISYDEMVTILEELDMKVDSNGNVTW